MTRVSFKGGNEGVNERPTSQEEAAAHERHIAPPPAQVQHVQEARSNPQLRVLEDRGKPPVAATPKPAAFNDHSAVPAKDGGHYNPPPNRDANAGARPDNNASRPPASVAPVHPGDLPPAARPEVPNTGNAKQDQKYQQQQEKLQQKQDQERQKLQQKQDQEHQRLDQQKANDAKRQQVEQKHQQQTQQLEQNTLSSKSANNNGSRNRNNNHSNTRPNLPSRRTLYGSITAVAWTSDAVPGFTARNYNSKKRRAALVRRKYPLL